MDKKNVWKTLEILLILVEHFHSHPELQDNFRNGGTSYVSKGPRPMANLISDLDKGADDLIRHISDWS